MDHYLSPSRILVSPQHVAGEGNSLTTLKALKDRAPGWSLQSHTDTGEICLTSPDGAITFRYHALATAPEPRWTAAHTGPRPWTATLSCHTPRELAHALLDPLTRLPCELDHGIRPLDEMGEDFHAARWRRTAYGTRTVFLSPDRLCTLSHTPHEETAWRIETQAPHSDDSERWHLSLSRNAPPQLARSVIHQLLRDEPVIRHPREIPHRLHRYADIAPIADLSGPPPPPHAPTPPPGRSR